MRTARVFRSRLLTPMMRASGGESAIEFCRRVDLDERLHVEFAAEGDEFAQSAVVESGDDQEETVGIVGARFPDLPGIEDEIFAQNGERDFFAGIAKIFQRAAEEFAFGENGESGGAGGFEGFGKRGGVKGIANDSARRRGGLEFGDNIEWHRGKERR